MIDRTKLYSILSELGDDGFQAVMAVFVVEMREILQALGSNPSATFTVHCHALRGTGQALGFVELARICEWYETGSGQGPPPAPPAGPLAAGLLTDCFEASLREMEDALTTAPATL